MAITLIITTAGRAALVNAENTGTDPVTVAEIGFSATAVVPSPAAVALPGEIKRLDSVAGEVVADDTIHVVATDESADAYSLRSFALYLEDGTLFAIYGQPTPILEKTASAFAALALDVVFEDIDAALLTFGDTDFLLPSANTERRGIVELATPAEAEAGVDNERALTPAQAKAKVLAWLLSQDGSGSGLDADKLDGFHAADFLFAAMNLADLDDVAEARENLGLGATFLAGLLYRANNLSDVADAKTARANLGLSDAEIYFAGAGF